LHNQAVTQAQQWRTNTAAIYLYPAYKVSIAGVKQVQETLAIGHRYGACQLGWAR
jgi:hypothetical protein